MLAAFEKFLKSSCLIDSKNALLVGASGGVDSMVLCHLLHQSKQNFAMAHCNFQLRGEEANEDQKFVEKLASYYKVPFYSTQFKTQEFSDQESLSIQMAARQLRFKWFEEIRSSNTYDFIAIASHKDDSIETFILNLLRGTGLEGVSGIKPIQNKIIHPMLFADKKQILDYAQKNALGFREDSSNASINYKRNQVRNQVIPLLTQIQPDFVDKIIQFQQIAIEHQSILASKVSEYQNTYVKGYSNNVIIEITTDLSEIILHELLKPFSFEHKQNFKIF